MLTLEEEASAEAAEELNAVISGKVAGVGGRGLGAGELNSSGADNSGGLPEFGFDFEMPGFGKLVPEGGDSVGKRSASAANGATSESFRGEKKIVDAMNAIDAFLNARRRGERSPPTASPGSA